MLEYRKGKGMGGEEGWGGKAKGKGKEKKGKDIESRILGVGAEFFNTLSETWLQNDGPASLLLYFILF